MSTELPDILSEAEIRQAIDMCIENGHCTYHFEEGRMSMELNNEAFIAGTFYYDIPIHATPDTSSDPEEYVTYLEDFDNGPEQVENIHNAVIQHSNVVYSYPPRFTTSGTFDFGLQYRSD